MAVKDICKKVKMGKFYFLKSPTKRNRKQKELRRRIYLNTVGRPTKGMRTEEATKAPEKEPRRSNPFPNP